MPQLNQLRVDLEPRLYLWACFVVHWDQTAFYFSVKPSKDAFYLVIPQTRGAVLGKVRLGGAGNACLSVFKPSFQVPGV